MPALIPFLRTFYFRLYFALPVKTMPDKNKAPSTIMWFSFQGIFLKAQTKLNIKFLCAYRGLSKLYNRSNGATHNLDFRIRILDLRSDRPAAQLASNIFNPQSKFQNLKSV
jgi:hypothetical protein